MYEIQNYLSHHFKKNQPILHFLPHHLHLYSYVTGQWSNHQLKIHSYHRSIKAEIDKNHKIQPNKMSRKVNKKTTHRILRGKQSLQNQPTQFLRENLSQLVYQEDHV